MHTISQKQATQTHPYIYKKKKRKKEKYFFYRKRRRRKRKGGKYRERPERPVRHPSPTSSSWKDAVSTAGVPSPTTPPTSRRPLPMKRLPATPGTGIRIKNHRICVRFPWGLPDRCGAMFRKSPGQSDTNPTGIEYKAQGNPAIWNLELTPINPFMNK